MKEAVVRDQRLEIGNPRPAIGVCRVIGCGETATVNDECGVYCWRCYEEITALLQWEKRRKDKREARELHRLLRREEWKDHMRRAAEFVRKWSWVPLAVLVIGGMAYVVVVESVPWLQWAGWF